ncbi:MAG TPA: Ku protein [Steroidobacteraceae bacterium]|jgi:DNA end-binding protein Ku
MPRAIWKGALSFGLVYIPIELHSASQSGTLDLDLLDRHDFAPVGYQRINKRTGAVVEWKDIVKGYQYRKGEYVALSDEDFRQANLKASQTIEIEHFVAAGEISPEYYETPYYLRPVKGGEKVYALLLQTLTRSGKVGIGKLVMRSRQHLSVITGDDDVMKLITLRFADEIRPAEALKLPSVNSKELGMAERLVAEMTAPWKPEVYHDTYREDLMKRINEKVKTKQTHVLTPPEKAAKGRKQSAEVIDLMSVLRKSLETRGGTHRAGAGGASRATPARASAHRRRTTRRRRTA